MKKIFAVISATFLMFVLSACGSSNELEKFSGVYNKLNTTVTVTMYHKKSVNTDKIDKKIKEQLTFYENEYDVYNKKSTLTKINETAYNNEVKITDQMFEMIQTSLEYARINDNTFDPTIHPLTLLWNIDDDSYFRGGTVPEQAQIDKVLESVGHEYVILNETNKTIKFTKPNIQLNLGSVVKGFIVDDILKLLEDEGVEHAIINAGASSQIYLGTRVKSITEGKEVRYEATEVPWNTGISKPFDIFGIETMGFFSTTDTSTSSSGVYRQYFRQDGKLYHHILSPETGYPVDNEIEYIQIFTDNYKEADALSTMLFILGLDKAMDYINKTDGLEGFIITNDQKIYLSNNSPVVNLYPEYQKDFKVLTYEG